MNIFTFTSDLGLNSIIAYFLGVGMLPNGGIIYKYERRTGILHHLQKAHKKVELRIPYGQFVLVGKKVSHLLPTYYLAK
jgi:hypothetical protein